VSRAFLFNWQVALMEAKHKRNSLWVSVVIILSELCMFFWDGPTVLRTQLEISILAVQLRLIDSLSPMLGAALDLLRVPLARIRWAIGGSYFPGRFRH
jgi:hypothetical protein